MPGGTMALDWNYNVTITFDRFWDTRRLVADAVSAEVALWVLPSVVMWRRRDGRRFICVRLSGYVWVDVYYNPGSR
jgi:hypothetical protein